MLTPTPIEYLDLDNDILANSKICDDELLNRFKQHVTDSDYCFGTNRFSLISIQDLKDLFDEFNEEHEEEFSDSDIKHIEILSAFLREIQSVSPDTYVNLEN